MPTAYSLIRDNPHYRSDAFMTGLEACGFKVRRTVSGGLIKDDVLVIWNRYGEYHTMANRFEQVGAHVLVVENGYYGVDEKGRRLYAISLNSHHAGGARIMPSGIRYEPYQEGKHILVCGQRGIGSPEMRSPTSWEDRVADKLSRMTKRKIIIRRHPGKNPSSNPLSNDLKDAHLCVVWSSCCGIEALVRGVPVAFDAPRWIGEESAMRLEDIFTKNIDIEHLKYMPQHRGLNKAASNQWSVAEIAKGVPFIELLRIGR